ncbi:condensation domain-containing protein, partial [Streptomyces sp. NPDC059578]|uniref:condensation domain-containing protein n=1 Tax=unclassified Streptomyces TaxID=2593676 RepID=UPI00365FDCC4
PLDPQPLRDHLAAHLPAYMIPTAYIPLPTLPLTRNGKIDLRALPIPSGPSRAVGAGSAPPNTEAERVLAAIWEGLLQVEGIGVDDDFFDLGGHSLLATQIVSRVRAALGVTVSVRDLFERPTIRRLAEALRTVRLPAGVPAIPSCTDERPELSFAQRRLWFFDQLVPGSAAYNVSETWRVDGALDPAVLQRALRAICDRHQVLRTTFRQSDGNPYQVIADSSGLTLDRYDLTAQGPGAEAEAVRLAYREGTRNFDLTTGPLIRAQLFRIAENRHCLALHLHHIVVDGWSMNVIWRELAVLYDDFAAERSASLPPVDIQYVDYAAWQRSWLHSELAERQLRFWTDLLRGAPASLELPADHLRPKQPSGRGRWISFELPADVAGALRSIGRDHAATPFMVMLTAFDVLLARYTGITDIVTGSPVAGRIRPELEKMAGFFANTFALRLGWTDDPTFVELLERLRGIVLDAQANQDVPFEWVVAELAPERDVSRNPVFQIIFALSGADETARPAGWAVERVGRDLGHARFDLEMQLQESGEGYAGSVCYSTDLFEHETVQRLVDHFLTLCASIVAYPRQRVSRLALYEGAERDRLLSLGAGVSPDLEPDSHVLGLFEARVASGPGVVAVECGGERWTYGELDG